MERSDSSEANSRSASQENLSFYEAHVLFHEEFSILDVTSRSQLKLNGRFGGTCLTCYTALYHRN
jgi:hypothetical protein